jgi:putative transposase
MARGPRVCFPGLTQHVVQRGNNRGPVFRDEGDYRVFLELLRRESVRRAIAVHAYALMSNHFHLMATPVDRSGLSKMMQAVGRSYVPLFNWRYQRTGGLWEGRYRSFAIESEAYWFTCLRYVELNPVRAGLVSSPEMYRWSSARAHVSGLPDPLVTDHVLYLRLGSTTDERQQAWRAICQAGMPDHELAQVRNAVRSSRLGDGVRPHESLRVMGSDPRI